MEKNQQYKNYKVKKNKYHDFETNSSEIKTTTTNKQTNKNRKAYRSEEGERKYARYFFFFKGLGQIVL